MELSRSAARKLGKNGLESGARVFRGLVKVGSNGVEIDGKSITDWLAQYNDSEVLLIAAPIVNVDDEVRLKTCYTCGRDYHGETCPSCAAARARLRG